jgi:hypothetical protein
MIDKNLMQIIKQKIRRLIIVKIKSMKEILLFIIKINFMMLQSQFSPLLRF